MDTSNAPDLKRFGSKVTTILSNWFPYIESLLLSPTYKKQTITRLVIKFESNYTGVAAAYWHKSPPIVIGSVNYYRNRKDDLGSMIHELVHIVQKYKKCDGWVTEGIADWVRYFHYEPQQKRPNKPKRNTSYRNGYGSSAYFLNWIESRYKWMIYYLNKDCREGTYNENIFKRLTGHSVDELWQMMLRD